MSSGESGQATCPQCGGVLTWIAQYGRWYCRTEQAYMPEGYSARAAAPPVRAAAPPAPAASTATPAAVTAEATPPSKPAGRGLAAAALAIAVVMNIFRRESSAAPVFDLADMA